MSVRNDLQDLEHAAVIAMLAEAAVVAFFIFVCGVFAALGAGA